MSNPGSSTDPTPRIPPAPLASLGPAGRLVAWVTARATHGDPPNVFTTLARHRRLFRHWLPFASWILYRTRLPRHDVELVILRTAWNCSSPYEWAQHVSLAARTRLDQMSIARVADGPDAHGWTDRQRVLLQATDELHEHRVITDRTWRTLADELSEDELIELCFVVGHYEMLALALNSLRVASEPSALARLDPRTSQVTDELRRSLARRRVTEP